jgi:rare lipoprotein A
MKLTSLIIVLLIILNSPCFGQTLTASWYSVESLKREGTWAYSHGRMANGKVFKNENLTCATRLWRIGTTLRITSLATNESVIVKVTDRIGKRFAKTRIDLAEGAFRKIDDTDKGLIKVKVEKI